MSGDEGAALRTLDFSSLTFRLVRSRSLRVFDSRPAFRRLPSLIASFVRGDSGQDLIEYALLTAVIGVTGILALSVLSTTMANAYASWHTGANNIAQPCAPQPAACP